MCLAVPLKVKSKMLDDRWQMEDGRLVKSLVGKVKKGDYLVCQQDVAVAKLSQNQAKAMRQTLKGVYGELQ